MIAQSRLEALETEVQRALSGSAGGLAVVGYGEISTVLAAEGTEGPVVCKRLPVMGATALARYRSVVAEYLDRLHERGLTVAPTEIHAVGEDPIAPYCVQPRFDRLLPEVLAEGPNDRGFIDELMTRIAAVVGGDVGLDAQVSNWAVTPGGLVYLDVTTPLLRDTTGAEQLDTGLFIASLPWALRGIVRRFLLDEILSHYYTLRPALLDVIGNLHKERLQHRIDEFIDAANRRVAPPITAREARRYYRSDATMWELLQRLRRADRWWQRRVRRRTYPFLLPGSIER